MAGKLIDDRFARLSAKYEDEQKELREKIKALQERIERTKSKAVTADMFVSAVRKYTRARKLTPRMLNELVQRIEVHQAEKVDGVGYSGLRSTITASARSPFLRTCRSLCRTLP